MSTFIGLRGGELFEVRESFHDMDVVDPHGPSYWVRLQQMDGSPIEIRRDQIAWRRVGQDNSVCDQCFDAKRYCTRTT